jgi:hypothetical protein
MKSVSGGVSPDRLARLRTRLTVLQRGLPAVRAAARSESGRQVVQELEKAIGRRLAEIADAVVVAELYERYDAVMAPVQGGVAGTAAADRLAQSLDDLAARIKDKRRAAGKGAGQEPFEKLTELVTARRAELDRVRTGLRVSDLVKRFNELVEPPRTPDPYTARTKLAGIREEARGLRRSHKKTLDPRETELLDELITTITKVLGR